MKLSKKLLFKAASLSMIAAISFGLGVSLTKTNSASIETKAELSGTWTEDSYWLQYTDPVYSETRIEQAVVSSEDGITFSMIFRVFGVPNESNEENYIDDINVNLYNCSFTSQEDDEIYGYVTGEIEAHLNGIDDGTQLSIYVMKSADISGNFINSYHEGWNYDEAAQFFVYYHEGQKSDAIIDRGDFSIYKENSSRLFLVLTITDRSAYQNFTIENCSYTLDGGFYTITGEWTDTSDPVSEITIKIAENAVEVYNFSALTYNSATQSFELISGEVTYPGTITNCAWLDYENLNLTSLSYLILDCRIEIEGQIRVYDFKITNLGEVSRTMSGTWVFTGDFEENAPGGSRVVSVNLEFENAIVQDIEMKRGFNYIESNRSLVYIDDTSWDVNIESAVYVEQDNESCFELSYTLHSPSGEGDRGNFTLENVTIKSYDESMQAGILVGQNVELFGTTTVSLRAFGITVSDCTVTFSPGEIASGSMEPQTAHICVEYPAPECEFSKDQYHFIEWLADNGETYKVGDPISITSNTLLLTAVFAHDTYSIIYNPNCEEGEYTGETETFVTEEQGTYPVGDCGFERAGFNFVGWATEPSGTAEYNVNDSIEVYESEIILYAVWEEEVVINEYVITLDANGGTGTMDPEVIEGTSSILSYTFKTPTFTWDGYTFKGWGTTPDATELYQPGEEKNDISESTTFYAIWERTSFTLTLVANDGSEDTSTVTVEKGSNPIPGCSFTREGFKFAGWAVGSPDSESILQEGDVINILKDYTLYATWTAYYSYTITLDPNGGTGTMEPEVIEGSSSTLTYTFKECAFTKEGYTFKGWAFQPEGGITFQPGDRRTDIDKDTTFYAIWEQATFRINFYANGGEGTMESQSVPKGDNPVPSCAFTKEGYDFAGWAVGSPESSTIIQPGSTVNVTQDYDLYATWEEIPTIKYTITFNANGGQGTMESAEVAPDVYPCPPCEFTNQGYYFVGWAINSPDGTIVKENEDLTVSGDMTLYAIWEVAQDRWVYTDETLYWEEGSVRFEVELIQGIYSEKNNSITLVANIFSEDSERVLYATKYILLTDAVLSADDSHIVEGYFSELELVVRLYVEEITNEIQPEDIKDEPLTPEQESQIKTLLPETEDSRATEILEGGEISQQTAYDIYTAVSDTKTELDNRRQTDPTYTEEQYQSDIETLQTVTEASVVVGAGSEVAEARGEAIDSAIPSESGLTQPMDEVLAEFYQIQMDYLLGKKPVPEKGEPNRKHLISRAGEEEPGIDLSVEEYDKMIDFVDESVENMESAALQIRNCSGSELKAVVNDYIQTVKISSFRDFDKAAADEEYVEQAYHSIMVTMQQQVIEALEKDHQPSTNQEKEAQYQEQLEAVKDYDTFEQIVIEVLRLKYVSATGQEIDYETFETIYMDIFRAWALNDESLNPHGITLEELTTATIETTTHKANKMTFSTNFTSGEKVFFFSMLGVVALAAGGITAYAVVSKKKRGLAK